MFWRPGGTTWRGVHVGGKSIPALELFTWNELRYVLDPQEVYGLDFPGETFRVLTKSPSSGGTKSPSSGRRRRS